MIQPIALAAEVSRADVTMVSKGFQAQSFLEKGVRGTSRTARLNSYNLDHPDDHLAHGLAFCYLCFRTLVLVCMPITDPCRLLETAGFRLPLILGTSRMYGSGLLPRFLEGTHLSCVPGFHVWAPLAVGVAP